MFLGRDIDFNETMFYIIVLTLSLSDFQSSQKSALWRNEHLGHLPSSRQGKIKKGDIVNWNRNVLKLFNLKSELHSFVISYCTVRNL